MHELTQGEIERQDFVDSAVFELIQVLNPTSQAIEWNIEVIAEVRECVQEWLVDKLQVCDEMAFYPYIELEE
jgi:hypothetical protein